jgi:hypothetical protein
VKSAWYVAMLQRADKLPDCGELMDRVSAAPDAEQTPKQQLAIARAIARSFGTRVRAES